MFGTIMEKFGLSSEEVGETPFDAGVVIKTEPNRPDEFSALFGDVNAYTPK